MPKGKLYKLPGVSKGKGKTRGLGVFGGSGTHYRSHRLRKKRYGAGKKRSRRLGVLKGVRRAIMHEGIMHARSGIY